MATVFVSYCQKQLAAVRRICEMLEEFRISYWVDYNRIKPGENIYDAMSQGIDQASVVLLCFSEDYEHSVNCKREAQYTADTGKPFIVVKLQREYKLTGAMKMLFGDSLYLDLVKLEAAGNFKEKLREALAGQYGNETSTQKNFLIACRKGMLDEVQSMLAASPAPLKLLTTNYDKSKHGDKIVDPGWSNNNNALHFASWGKAFETVRFLVDKATDLMENGNHYLAFLNQPNDATNTPLHEACAVGSVDIVKFLLQRGAQVDPLGERRTTPLMWAAEKGFIEVVKVLVESRADINARDWNGKSPLMAAMSHNQTVVADYLRSKGAKA